MKKKYYYDCWIQALYMMREFDVKFFTKGFLNIESDFLEMELGYHLTIRDIYGKLANDYTKIYVAPESEHIFEPKEGDIGQMKAEGARFFVKYSEGSKEWKEWPGGGYYSNKNGSDIIYRDGKHFFNPKEEN